MTRRAEYGQKASFEPDYDAGIVDNLRSLCDLTRQAIHLIDQDEAACLADVLARRRSCMELIDRINTRGCIPEAHGRQTPTASAEAPAAGLTWTAACRDELLILSELDAEMKIKAEAKLRQYRQVLSARTSQPVDGWPARDGTQRGRLLDLTR